MTKAGTDTDSLRPPERVNEERLHDELSADGVKESEQPLDSTRIGCAEAIWPAARQASAVKSNVLIAQRRDEAFSPAERAKRDDSAKEGKWLWDDK